MRPYFVRYIRKHRADLWSSTYMVNDEIQVLLELYCPYRRSQNHGVWLQIFLWSTCIIEIKGKVRWEKLEKVVGEIRDQSGGILYNNNNNIIILAHYYYIILILTSTLLYVYFILLIFRNEIYITLTRRVYKKWNTVEIPPSTCFKLQ